jgi:hypothetical protein
MTGSPLRPCVRLDAHGTSSRPLCLRTGEHCIFAIASERFVNAGVIQDEYRDFARSRTH